jgi:signal transduction histidine kinase/CheY-specific phosphatase CheX
MLSLLPQEIERESMLLKADFKILEDGRFMVVLADITEERRLQAMLKGERERLEFIVAAVSDRRSFFEATGAFQSFLTTGLPSLLSDEKASALVGARRIYRELHTYKGVLGQFGFIATSHALHEAETCLSRLMSEGEALSWNDVAAAVSQQLLQSSMDKELSVLAAVLGEDFLGNGERLVLPGRQAMQLEDLAIRLLQGEIVDATAPDVRALLNTLATVRKVTIKKVLMDFDGLVKRAASRLDKDVATIEVSGGEALWIEPQPYQAFFHALVHVFRNAVAHGLETPEGRWAAGKDEHGRITCHVLSQNGIVSLSIADDGAGIDLGTLRKRAVQVGLHTADEVNRMADDEVVRLIFHDNMSTGERVTEFAGRGVGLAAVREETRKLGGEVDVTTVAGRGTRFVFSLPMQHCFTGGIEHPGLDDALAFVMQSVVTKTRLYFENEHQLEVTVTRAEVGEIASMSLLDLTAMIRLGGQINLLVVFCFQQSLVDAVCKWMTDGFDDYPEALETYREAAVGEVVNTILGHCTTDLQHLDREGVSMTPPAIISRLDVEQGMHAPMFYTQGLNTALGCLNISLVGSKDVFSTTLD